MSAPEELVPVDLPEGELREAVRLAQASCRRAVELARAKAPASAKGRLSLFEERFDSALLGLVLIAQERP